MKNFIINNKSTLAHYYLNYINTIETNKKLISNNLTDSQISQLYDSKYKLTEFQIYKYITAYDFINDSLGCSKFSLTEGITTDKYKYNNILIDLFYKNIDESLVRYTHLDILFGIKQNKSGEISDLTRSDKLNSHDPFESKYFNKEKSFWLQDYTCYRELNKDYAGNSYTYFIFKQLIKLFLTEVYLYNYNGNVFTYNEIENKYSLYIENLIKYESVKSFDQWMLYNNIKKVQYQCVKVLDPNDIVYSTIEDIKIKLINVNTRGDFIQMYDSIVEKDLSSFWNYQWYRDNTGFLIDNKLIKFYNMN